MSIQISISPKQFSIQWSFFSQLNKLFILMNQMIKIDKFPTLPAAHRLRTADIYYIQIHHFMQQTMLNQSLYYTTQYLEPNTKSRGMVTTHPLVAGVTINSLVA